jgi:hypothetical protein
MFPRVPTDRKLSEESSGSVGTNGGNMRLYQSTFIREKKMYKAVMYGLWLLKHFRDCQLEAAARKAAAIHKVDEKKLLKRLEKWTGFPLESQKKSWPFCSVCQEYGRSVLAAWEVHLDRNLGDVKKTYEQYHGPNLHPKMPFLCDGCYSVRRKDLRKGLVAPDEWYEVFERIDPRCFRAYRQVQLAG